MSSIDPSPMAKPKSARLLAALLIVIVFAAGIILGVAGERLYLIRTHQLFPARLSHMFAQRVLRRLDRELHLTPEQHTAVQRILDERERRLAAVFAAVRPQMRQQIDETNAAIEKVLTPDQRVKFEALRQHARQQHPGFLH